MKILHIIILTIICCAFAGCEKDNFDAPKATLSGKVTYNGNAVGVRTNATQLELWQDGYALHSKIPVYIAQDGTFSASLFNGQYKLVRLAGAPWIAQASDTIVIDVKGNTVVDIPVTPYFAISKESYTKGAGTITAKFTINKIVESANLGEVSVFFGKSILTDSQKNENDQVDEANKYNEGQPYIKVDKIVLEKETIATINIPNKLADADYLFIRIGVRATVSSEYYYTQVQKISLK